MPAFTPNLNLYKPGGGSTGLILPDEVVDIDRLNDNSDKIDAFAGGWGMAADRNHQFYGPTSALGSVAGMKRGDTYQESDGAFLQWRYTGTNWVTNEGGLYRVKPQSASGPGVSISSEGVVRGGFTGSVDILGCFGAAYKYLVDIQIQNATASAEISYGFLNGTTLLGTYTGVYLVQGISIALAKTEFSAASIASGLRHHTNGMGAQLNVHWPQKPDYPRHFDFSCIGGDGNYRAGGGSVSNNADPITGLRLTFGANYNARISIYEYA